MRNRSTQFIRSTYKPSGTIPSVAKCFFRKTCCKSVAKTEWKIITNPQALENKGFAGTCQPGAIIPTLQQVSFLKQFCLEDMYSCSSDYLWYPYYPEYHDYCYQNVISRDNTRLSPADNINWLGCIIASRGVNLNIRFDPDERLNWNLLFII